MNAPEKITQLETVAADLEKTARRIRNSPEYYHDPMHGRCADAHERRAKELRDEASSYKGQLAPKR